MWSASLRFASDERRRLRQGDSLDRRDELGARLDRPGGQSVDRLLDGIGGVQFTRPFEQPCLVGRKGDGVE
jgi:hypothetical protein